jgi:hypothetical protein
MVTLEQLVTSTEPIEFQIGARYLGVAYDPTSDPVAVAILPSGSPQPDPETGPWHTAEWETDPGNQYWASVQVGPLNGGITLYPGTYDCYVKVTDNPAVPVKLGAYLVIT